MKRIDYTDRMVPEDKRDSSTVTGWSLRPYKHIDKKKTFFPKENEIFKILEISASETAVLTKMHGKKGFFD